MPSDKDLDSVASNAVAKFLSSKVAHYTGKISPKSKVQCPKSAAVNSDFGHWTFAFELITARRKIRLSDSYSLALYF
jgi:hypothetical protein